MPKRRQDGEEEAKPCTIKKDNRPRKIQTKNIKYTYTWIQQKLTLDLVAVNWNLIFLLLLTSQLMQIETGWK